MRIFITGGAGYVASRLVPRLLDLGHQVTVFDAFWFGDHLPTDEHDLIKIHGDIRGKSLPAILKAERPQAVIHLACISNDPSCELDESLSRTINFEAFEPLVIAAKEAGVQRFIYCSTSSVYGISDAPDVKEDHPLVPLTLYNTYKAQCEPLLFKHQSDDFICTTIRPSTVCGYSPRQRLDLAVNILTNLAVNKGTITVFGGAQMRPNIHIEDMCDAYITLLNAPASKIAGETFNVGARNYSIRALAEIVRRVVHDEYEDRFPDIEVQPLQDQRSYQVNSDKIANVLGFRPRRTVEDAVRDLCDAFKNDLIPNPLDDDNYYNVRRMRKVWADLYKDAPPSSFDPTLGHLSEIDRIHRQ